MMQINIEMEIEVCNSKQQISDDCVEQFWIY